MGAGRRALTARWPRDIRAHAVDRARAADAAAGASPEGAAATVLALYQRVWSGGDAAAIPWLVAPAYSVTSDPGDPWAGLAPDDLFVGLPDGGRTGDR